MKGLSEEIFNFLAESGYNLKCLTTGGIHNVLSVVMPDQKERWIIPLSISATDHRQALKAVEEAVSSIDRITAKTGCRPLLIIQDRWNSQKAMTRSRLLSHLEQFTQIYARNCEIRKIDKDTAAEFLKHNHSYGDAACRYRYGLYLKRHTGHNTALTTIVPGTLVAVATFSNARKWIKGDKVVRSYEWTRYASLPQVRLSGGMGKMLQAFIDDVKPDDIMTYADLEWSEGKVYEALGFTLEGHKAPVTFAIDTSDWSRTALRMNENETAPLQDSIRYYVNFGSNKYRLKLTDYH